METPWWLKKNIKERESKEEYLARLQRVEDKIKKVGHRWCWLCWKDCGTQEKRDRHMRKVHRIGANENDDKQKKLFV